MPEEAKTSWKTIIAAALLSGSLGIGGGGFAGSTVGAVRAEEKIKVIEEKLTEQRQAIKEVDEKTEDNSRQLERIDERTILIIKAIEKVEKKL